MIFHINNFRGFFVIKKYIVATSLALAFLGGCAMSPNVQYKTGTTPITVSVSDGNLSSFTEVPADEIRLKNSNVFVGGAPTSLTFVGVIAVDNTAAGNARIAKNVPSSFGVALAPLVSDAMQRTAQTLKTQPLVLSNEHSEALDIQITPLLHVLHVGGGAFTLSAHLKVGFLDTTGKRQTRTYMYRSQLALPLSGTPINWTADDNRIYKRHLAVAFEAMAKVILMDQQGKFQEALASPTPNVIRETPVGFLTSKDVLFAEFDQLRVTHGMVGSIRGLQAFEIEDMRSPEVLVKL